MVYQITASEQEVIQMQKNKEKAALYDAERRRLQELAQKVVSVFGTIDPEDGIVIYNQDEAEELLEMAAMYME